MSLTLGPEVDRVAGAKIDCDRKEGITAVDVTVLRVE